MSDKPCNDCGLNHNNQRFDFPEGATVVVIGTFEHPASLEERVTIPIGTIGTVLTHCADGRAWMVFEGYDNSSHTFHYPSGYVAKANV